jgi:hypothetical protein
MIWILGVETPKGVRVALPTDKILSLELDGLVVQAVVFQSTTIDPDAPWVFKHLINDSEDYDSQAHIMDMDLITSPHN